ncbi:12412_t:CDS:1 [Funneliformis caledonium]|uniref:12412_t:CDS:1 n=1 Tax=Funneliformis caledonium TaxID=1117310 RepID=A0A9N9GSI3_9GLOM|nr:12412_t:CDS:1 [Funneliformis caledonium]
MALEICRENSARFPNSFIIFRTFFSRSLNISTISSFDVGKISVLAQSVWKVASENMKNAFSQLSKNAENYLRTFRAPSFISHKPRTKNFSSSNFTNSTFERKELPPSNERNLHPLCFEIMTAKDFRKDEPFVDLMDSQFVDDSFDDDFIISNESMFYEFDEGCFDIFHMDSSPSSYSPGDIFTQGCQFEVSVDTTLLFEGIQIQESSQPEPEETKIEFDDTDAYDFFYGNLSDEDKIGLQLQFKNHDSIFL